MQQWSSTSQCQLQCPILSALVDKFSSHRITLYRTWVSAPLIVVPIHCSQCQVVESIRAKIRITPESFHHSQFCFCLVISDSPFPIARLVELFRDIASSLNPQVAALLAKPPHLSRDKVVNGKNKENGTGSALVILLAITEKDLTSAS